MKQYVCRENNVGKEIIINYDSTCMLIEVDGKYIINIFPDTKTFVVNEIGGN